VRKSVVFSVLGSLLFYLAAAPLVPLAVALWPLSQTDPGWWGFLAASGLALAGAFACRRFARLPEDFEHLESSEGFAVVVFGWLLTCLVGSIPYVLLPGFYESFGDALFESVSGFTTTGATVLSADEVGRLPESFHLWRVMTHWIGGMGILVMVLAVLPTLGAGGVRASRLEPGLAAERLTPRIRDTVMLFLKIYIALTVAAALLLWLVGRMSIFNAICHALSAMATGGFSTKGDSIAGFESGVVELLMIIFMVAAAMNYIFYYYLFIRRNPREALGHTEPRAYLTFLFVCIGIVWAVLWINSFTSDDGGGALSALRRAAFQVCAIGTTTGFTTDNYSKWPALAQLVILVLMFTGGCAGSTGGGMKIGRLVLLFKAAWREVLRVAVPRRVVAVTLDGRGAGDQEIERAAGFFLLYIAVAIAATGLLAAMGLTFETSFSAAVAALGSIGPGFGEVGPAGNYGGLPEAAKYVLSVVMILGRLEIYVVLALFLPSTWR